MNRPSNQDHITITQAIKAQIDTLSIVYPAHYAKLYAQEAKSKGIALNPSDLLSAELLDERMVAYVLALSDCARHALSAMQSDDKQSLMNVIEETKALRQELESLRQAVYEDTLTKSYNRKWLEANYLQEDRSTFKHSGVIAFVDLNRFKAINDAFGHLVGDRVLLHVSHALKQSGGAVVRYGGDEFLVLFANVHHVSQARQRIESIAERYAKTSMKIESQLFKVSFSYGVVAFDERTTLEEVLSKADEAMYRHKRGEVA